MKNAKSVPGLVLGIVFLDIVGFSILFPLFPAMLEHYLALEGANSALGRLSASLAELAQGEKLAVATLFGGLLGSLYSLLQFAFAPIWGGLSDRIGRRPTLLVTLAGTVASYVLWMFAGSFALLIVSRLLAGIMAGNISTATAVVADSTRAEERAAGMGLVGMCIGLGFVLGPAIGGIAWHLQGPGAGPWQSGWHWTPFSVPASVACGLALVNLLWCAARLRESLPPDRRDAAPTRVWNPIGELVRLRLPGVTRTAVVYFLFLAIFSAMEFTLVFLAVERLAYTPRQNAWMFVFVGLVIALVQGGVVRRLAPERGEKRLVLVGLTLLVPGFLLLAWAQTAPVLYAGLFLMAVGSALAMPCLSALASRYAPAQRQGLVLGHFRSAGALARAVGPLAGGVLYWRLGSAAPYLLGAAALLLPVLLAARLPAPEPAREPAPGAPS